MKDALGYYKILQVTEDADADRIKHSYRDLAKIWHPDYNQNKDTTDVFQELSVAYETLSDKQSRLVYDTLSLVYGKDNYPDLEAMTPFKDGSEGINLRAVNLQEVKAWLVGYKTERRFKVVSPGGALHLNAKTAAVNWLAGWWQIKAFFTNIKALLGNFRHPLSSEESLRILIHNMVAYAKDNQPLAAAKCGMQALELATVEERRYINDFLAGLNVKTTRPPKWNLPALKFVQLIVPGCLLLLLLLPLTGGYLNLSEAELWSLFAKKKEIDYYQRVDFGGRGQSVDDVVVGKIMSIPVDKSDNSKLYYLTKESKIMYGPSADFDVIKILPLKTTVRLTGLTPDNIWARVMIDNGETGFVRYEDIKQGIGKEIPFGSSIIE